MKGIIGKKVGMAQIFDENGQVIRLFSLASKNCRPRQTVPRG